MAPGAYRAEADSTSRWNVLAPEYSKDFRSLYGPANKRDGRYGPDHGGPKAGVNAISDALLPAFPKP